MLQFFSTRQLCETKDLADSFVGQYFWAYASRGGKLGMAQIVRIDDDKWAMRLSEVTYEPEKLLEQFPNVNFVLIGPQPDPSAV